MSHDNNEAVCKLDANRILRDSIRYDKPTAAVQLEEFHFTILLFYIFIQRVIKVWYCCIYFIWNACESNVEVDTRLSGYLSTFSGIYDFITIIIRGGPTEKYVPCFQRIRNKFALNMSNTQFLTLFTIYYFCCSGFLENSVEIYWTTILKSDVKTIALLSMSILRIGILQTLLQLRKKQLCIYLNAMWKLRIWDV